MEQKVKRPVWVWVISIFNFFSTVWTLLSFLIIMYGSVELPEAQRNYFNALKTIDYVILVGTVLLSLIAAIFLFLLKRIAYQLFLASLILGTIVTIWHAMFYGWIDALDKASLILTVISFGILIAVCIYAKKLINRGVLT